MAKDFGMTVQFTVNSNLQSYLEQGEWFGVEFADALAAETVEEAKHLVSPGVGPGPHPHRTEHEDTGALRDAIVHSATWRDAGSAGIAAVTIDPDAQPREGVTPPSEYGVYLEMGWNAASGRHYRYPWLYPAAMIAQQRWQEIGKAKADRFLKLKGRPKRITTELSATWTPPEWPGLE